MKPRVDAHLHLWTLSAGAYEWMPRDGRGLDRSFEAEEAEPHLRAASIDGAILVQADNTAADTQEMLARAERWSWIAGVVGWLPLADPDVTAETLPALLASQFLRGVRHPVEVEAGGTVRPAILESLALLAAEDVPFEVIGVRGASAIADGAPGLRIVIDHLGGPDIQGGEWQPWADLMVEAAARPGTVTKFAGLGTAAGPGRGTSEGLRRYVEHALACFGPDRVMFGSDWPVCTASGGYARAVEVAGEILDSLPADDREEIMGGNANRFYGLGLEVD